MNKPELLATAADLHELKLMLDAGADAVNIGGPRYALRTAGRFSIEEIQQAATLVHESNKKLYLSVNSVMHNEDLDGLAAYLKSVAETGVDAIVFSDPAVLMVVREEGMELPLHWSADIISTNYQTVNYWGKKGVQRAELARELNMDEIIELKENAEIEIQVQIHGIMCIFHSKRELVSNYFHQAGQKVDHRSDGLKSRHLFLKEEKRQDQEYPIYEDDQGTHIMSSEDICMIDQLPELIDAGIDSFKIEGLMKPTSYLEQVVRLYRKAIDVYLEDSEAYMKQADEWRREIEEIQPKGRPLTTGFFYKEQIF